MQRFYPFYYQYEVRPVDSDPERSSTLTALATVIVFAESDAIGRARAGRYIAGKKFEIVEVKRAMLIEHRHVAGFEGVLKRLYTGAEQQGISACFDSWSADGKPQTSW